MLIDSGKDVHHAPHTNSMKGRCAMRPSHPPRARPGLVLVRNQLLVELSVAAFCTLR